jgi:uncharacterized small protein (DUF1192 family)
MARWRETPLELKHSGSIGQKDVSQLSDEELMSRITFLAGEIGFVPAETIEAKPAPAATELLPPHGALRLVPSD